MGYENSGRRPNPNKIRILKGEKNKSRYNPDEPQPPTDKVERPTTLSPGAVVVWNDVAPVLLKMETLTVADVPTFAVYCELQASFTANALRKDSEGFLRTQEVALANALRPYFEYFGMTAGGRARIRLPKKDDTPKSKWAGVLA